MPARLAHAFKETRRNIDVIFDVNRYALETPDGVIHDVDEFKPWARSLFNLIWMNALEMRRVYSATSSGGDELYERVIVKQEQQFCVLYKMRPPLQGSVLDCGAPYLDMIRNFNHSISWSSKVLPPKDAWLEACKLFLGGKTENCRENYVNHSATIVRRTKEGELNYIVELSNYYDETKHQRKNRPNYLIYEIDPVKKSVCFIAAREKNGGHRELSAISQQPPCNP